MTNPNYIPVTAETLPSLWVHAQSDKYDPVFNENLFYRRVVGLDSDIGTIRQYPAIDPAYITYHDFYLPRSFAEKWTQFFCQYQMNYDSGAQPPQKTLESRYDDMIFARHMLGENTSDFRCLDVDSDKISTQWSERNPRFTFGNTTPLFGQLALGDIACLFSRRRLSWRCERVFIDLGTRDNQILLTMGYGGYLAITTYMGLMQAFENSQFAQEHREDIGVSYKFRQPKPHLSVREA